MAVDPQPKITKQEFASRLKAKYPQYQNIDDSTLVAKMLVKYPQYQDTLLPDQTQPEIPTGEPTAEETATHVLGTVNKVISDVPQQMLQGAGVFIAGGADYLRQGAQALGVPGMDQPITPEQNPLYNIGKKVEEVKAKVIDYTPDSRLADSFWATDIPSGLGSVAAVMLSGGLSAEAQVLKTAAAFSGKQVAKNALKALGTKPVVTGGVMMAMPEYDAAIASGASEQEAFNVFLGNYLVGGTETIPIENALKFINQVTGNRIMRTLKSGAVGTFEEAVQEGLQTYLTNKIAEGTYDPDRNPLDGIVRSMLAGGVIGGGMASIGGALTKGEQTEVQKASTQAAAIGQQHANEASDLSTGNPDLDRELRAAEEAVTANIGKITADVDEFAASKVADEVASAQQQAKEARQKAAELEDESALLKIRQEWESTPTVQQTLPISEEEAQFGDDSAAALKAQPIQPIQPNAVQEPSTAGVDVQQQATNGPEVGKAHPEKQKVAQKNKPTKRELESLKYHSTTAPAGISLDENFDKDVSTLGSGFMHIGTSAAADQRASENKKTESKKYSIKLNPNAKFLNVKDTGEPLHIENVLDGLVEAGDLSVSFKKALMDEMESSGLDNDQKQSFVADVAKSYGYDATRYQNTAEGQHAAYSYGIMSKNAILSMKEEGKKKTGTEKRAAAKVEPKAPKQKTEPAEVKEKPAKVETEEEKISRMEKIAERAAKAEQEAIENHEHVATRMSRSIVTTLKQKPSQVRKALPALAEKAAALFEKTGYEGYKSIANEADAQMARYEEKRAEIEKKKAESAEIQKAKKSKTLTMEEFQAKRKEDKAQKIAKEEKKLKNKKITIDGKEKTVGETTDHFYLKIAKTLVNEEGKKATDNAINEFIQFRKDNNLPLKKTKDEILKKAEAYKVAATKERERSGRQSTIDKKAAKKRGMTLEAYLQNKDLILGAEAAQMSLSEYVKKKEAEGEVIENVPEVKETAAQAAKRDIEEQRKAEKQAMEDFNRELGISGDETDIMFIKGHASHDESVADYIDKNDLGNNPKKELTVDEYNALAPRSQGPILRALQRVINKYISKHTKFITIELTEEQIKDNPPFLGFHSSNPKNNNATIVILVDSKGRPIGDRTGRNTVLHEYLHDYTKLMFTRLYQADRGFQSKMNRVFFTIKNHVFTKTDKILSKLKKGQELTAEENVLLDAIRQYTGEGRLVDLGVNVTTEQLFSEHNFYAFHDVDEFLSEVFSDPHTVAFLSQVKLDEKIGSGPLKGTSKSLLYKWFEDLFDYVKEKFKLNSVENNALDYTLNSIALYDEQFANEVLPENEGPINIARITEMAAPKGKKPLTGKQIANKIKDSLVRQLELTRAVQSENDVRKFIKRINSKLPLKSQISEDTLAPQVWKEVKAKRDTLKGDISRAQLAIDWMKKQPEYLKKNSKFWYDTNLFAKVDLSKMTSLERHQFITKGLIPLAHNNASMPHTLYNRVIKTLVKDRATELEKLGPHLRKGWLTKMMLNATNIMTSTSALTKFRQGIANKYLELVHKDFLWAATRSGVLAQDFYKSLEKLALNKHNLTHQHLSKIGMYGRIFSTKENPTVQGLWEEEVKRNAQFVVEAAQAKLKAFDDKYYNALDRKQILKEIEIAKDILAKFTTNPSLDGILSKGEKEVYDAIVAFAKQHEADFFRNAEAVWGKKPPQLYNYFPSIAVGKTGASSVKEDPLIRTGADSLYDALGQGADYDDVHGRRVFSTYERTNPKGYYYEFDALGIGKRWSKGMLFDIYASTPLKITNQLLKSDEAYNAFGGEEIRSKVIKQVKTAAGSGIIYDPNMPGLVRAFLGFRDAVYMAKIVTIGQFAMQLSSGVAAATVISANINPVKATKTMAKAIEASSGAMKETSKFHQLLKERGLGIQLRNVGFEKHLSQEDFKSYTSVRYNKLKTWAENTSDWATSSGDKLAARMVWFATYFDAGGTLDNINEEAVLKAERLTGTLQNMSDARWTAPIFRYNSVAAKVLAGMVYSYKTFALNAWLSLISGLRNFNSKEARTVAAAQFGSYVAYHAASVLIGKYVFGSMYKAMTEGITGEDGDDEEEQSFSDFQKIMAGATWDMMVGSVAPAAIDQLLRFYVLDKFGGAQKIWGDPDEEFNKYLDSPLFSPTEAGSAYKTLAGPGLGEILQATEDAGNAYAIYNAAAMQDEALSEEDIFKIDMYKMNILADAIGSTKIMPFRGDFRKAIKAYIKERNATKRREKEMMKGSGGRFDFGTDIEGNSNDSNTTIDLQDISTWTDEAPNN